MSDYDDGARRYRSSRTRPRERGEPEYVQETTYVERGKGPPPRDLVTRRRDDSVETIQRDFPPPGGDRYRRDDRYRGDDYHRDDRYRDDRYDDRPPRRARSAAGRRGRYDDDRLSDYEVPAAAGVAGYAAGRASERERRRRHRDYDSDSPSPHRRDHRDRSREKKDDPLGAVGDVLKGLGLGGVAGALLGKDKDKKDRSQSRDRGGRRDSGRQRRRSGSASSREGKKGDKTERKWAQAAQAALVAGAVEAFRSRNEPGPWTGQKGRRIATAALGAGGIDGIRDNDPDKKSKRHLAEAVIGGLAANRIANGPRERDRSVGPDGKTRSPSRSIFSRSKSRGRDANGRDEKAGGGGNALTGLAAGGALAAAGKAIYDRVRSKSRQRKRSPSTSSTDSYEPPSRSRRPRGGQAGDPDSRNSDTTNGDRARGPRDINGPLAAGAAGAGAGALATRGTPNGGSVGLQRTNSVDSSSSSSLEDVEKKRKRMRGKELITAGLATVATIHAAHGVYSSMEAHEKRHKLVAEGEMSPEEARKKQTKAWVQDAAAVGIAALGIKGAFSEWKEMNEHRYGTGDAHGS